MSAAFGLIACEVFSEELREIGEAVAKESGVSSPLWKKEVWFPIGLHDTPDLLRKELQAAVDSWEADPDFSHIVFAYGLCGNGIVGLQAHSKPLVVPRAHDCISVLLGGAAAHEALVRETPGIYFYSPGWIRARRVPGPDREQWLREFHSARYPDDPELVEELVDADAEVFARHRCAAYVSVMERPEAERYSRRCAEHLGWEFRRLNGNDSMLKNLLLGNWDNPDFLVVPPGGKILRAADQRLIIVQPCESAPSA